MSDAEKVKEFTEGYLDKKCPNYPMKLNKDQVYFITRMVMSELHELAATVNNNENESYNFLSDCLKNIDKCHNYNYENDIQIISAQSDAMVDIWYYMLNCASKNGINLSKLFDVVHQANMNKRDPQSGKFIKRQSDGKIIKPEVWMPPDIEGEIKKQCEKGSWN